MHLAAKDIVPNPAPSVKTGRIIYVGKVGPWRRYVRDVVRATAGETRIVDLNRNGGSV